MGGPVSDFVAAIVRQPRLIWLKSAGLTANASNGRISLPGKPIAYQATVRLEWNDRYQMLNQLSRFQLQMAHIAALRGLLALEMGDLEAARRDLQEADALAGKRLLFEPRPTILRYLEEIDKRRTPRDSRPAPPDW